MPPEMTEIVDGLGRAFEEFKKSNDVALKKHDVVLEEKLRKLDETMDRLEDQKAQIEAEAKRADELEKRLNRMGLGGAGGEDKAAAELKTFNAMLGAQAAEQKRAFAALDHDGLRAYKAGLDTFLRKGRDAFFDGERKAMSVGADPDGGYLVPADMTGRIITRVFDLSPIRAISAVQAISADALEGLADYDEAGFAWVGETEARAETTTPNLGKYRIQAEEMYAYPRTTRKLLDDAVVDVGAWLEGKAAERFARAEGQSFVAGNGIARPRGFTTYPTAATADGSRAWGTLEHINTTASGAFGASNPADVLIVVVEAMKDGYRDGCTWVTRRSVISLIRKMKEATTNAYLWQPGLAQGQPPTLLGFPVVKAEDMPALAAGSLSMAFGNFGVAYQVVDRLGLRVIRDEITQPGFVKFHVFRRVGGAVVQFEALKFVRFGS
ncbi:phage major capsid protein [Elioraea sp.]|uniref:phage major capsid protein n=1 Tax=Elioraea sp. TaxID=2185103 RepID=UPI0025C2101B|nr:phage major capsid protein [Elioraea sp.]